MKSTQVELIIANREIENLAFTLVETENALYDFSTEGASLERLRFKRQLGDAMGTIATIFPSADTERENRCFLVALADKTPFFYTLVERIDNKDTVDLIPLLKEILAINPAIKIMGSPWSAPVWMKDNGSTIGGSLQPQYYNVYANYFVKYIQQMQLKGIPINAITIQNEPQNPGNNPSLLMSATQQANFIKNNLGPAFQSAGIGTKIIIWDHNCDNANYPISILNDAAAKTFIDGSAFHLYNGDISALSNVHTAHPDKNLYFTEQWTPGSGSFDGDLKWHVKNVIIGSMRNWSKVALEWNLANDPVYGPHTPGGCTECKGAITISGSSISKNVGYYIVAHASKFVPPGSVRISSSLVSNLPNVAFKTPSGKKILIAVNESASTISFNISYKGRYIITSLSAGNVATYSW